MEPATIESLITKAAQLTLFVLMLGMGLNLTIRQLSYLWNKPGLLIRVLLASFVLVPLAAAIVVGILPLSAPVRIGIALMAITPGAPLIYRKISKMGWNATLAASYQVTVSLLAIVFLPVLAAVLSNLYPNQGVITPLEVFKQILAVQIIPLTIGLAIRAGIPDLAEQMEDFVSPIGNVMFLALGVLILIKGLEQVLSAGILPILAIALIAAASLAIGHFLAGADSRDRATLAIANATRNPGLALVITVFNFTKAEILPTIIVYALVCAIAVTLYHNRYKRTLTSAVE
ncbi:MAG: bile acid:sodium symporter [Fischerella sp. CENA71]|nr:bile acid:sodium symporter [Fischerella sp. CENA71]